MKKLLFLAVALIMGVSAANAQEFTYGVKAGANLANVTNMEADMKISLYAGAFAEYKFNDWLAVSPELLYSRQGAAYSEGGDKFKYRFNYINLPVLAKFYVIDGLSIDVGPQFGYMLNARVWGKVDGETATVDFEDAADVELNKFDIGIVAGATYNITENIFVQARYNFGLTDGIKDNPGKAAKNSVIQIGAGYRF